MDQCISDFARPPLVSAGIYATGNHFLSRWYQPLLYLWASPNSLLGLLLVPFALLQGGRARIVRGVLEAHGGVITWFLRQGFPLGVSAAAMTLGHFGDSSMISSLRKKLR